MVAADVSRVLPRVLIVSRRCVRKNKFVDFVGEYHLDLIVKYGAVPVIVPRVVGVCSLLKSFEPIHGVLLCEGEDIDPTMYGADAVDLTEEELEEVRSLYAGDVAADREKDSIELALANLCLEKNIPYLGICRGSQILNVACGGTLYHDVGKQLTRQGREKVVHMDYANYDGHRHGVRVVEGTPLHEWFRESLEAEGKMEIMVNSYHHQGVKKLAERFVPMAFAGDGLVEGFYDPDTFKPEEGRFIMGLQFHPERMQHPESSEFDYPGCPAAYREFVKAVVAYQRKVGDSSPKLEQEMERRRRAIVRSFSIARNLYGSRLPDLASSEGSELEIGAEFLQSNAALSSVQEKRLKQMGATVRNSSSYMEKVSKDREREEKARSFMAKMSTEQLAELHTFYGMMEKMCSEVLERKIVAL